MFVVEFLSTVAKVLPFPIPAKNHEGTTRDATSRPSGLTLVNKTRHFYHLSVKEAEHSRLMHNFAENKGY